MPSSLTGVFELSIDAHGWDLCPPPNATMDDLELMLPILKAINTALRLGTVAVTEAAA